MKLPWVSRKRFEAMRRLAEKEISCTARNQAGIAMMALDLLARMAKLPPQRPTDGKTRTRYDIMYYLAKEKENAVRGRDILLRVVKTLIEEKP